MKQQAVGFNNMIHLLGFRVFKILSILNNYLDPYKSLGKISKQVTFLRGT